MKTEHRAIELAQKAIGMIKQHQSQSESSAHPHTAKKIRDGYDIFQLPAGTFYGKNLVNKPPYIGNEYVYINVEAVDGRSKKYRVWSTSKLTEYVAFGGWKTGVTNPPVWRLPIVGRELELAAGVTGSVKQNVYWVNDHTQMDIEFDVELDYPGGEVAVHIARQSPANNYVKGKDLFFASVLTAVEPGILHTPCVLAWTEYGWLTLVCSKPGRHLRGYITVTLEPDGPSWIAEQRAPFA